MMPGALWAQAPSTIKIDAKAVLLPVTVRDKHGKIVPNLTKDDFVLNVDGAPQPINYFAHDSDLPLTLGLLVDTSRSMRNALNDERTASQKFLDQMVTAKDKAFLIQFDREVDLVEDVTDSKDKLQRGLDQLGAPQFSGSSSGSADSGERHGAGGGTTLYDAIFLASSDVMAKQSGRKALVILTDGVDRGSKETLNSAVEAAQRSDTAVYAIYFKGEQAGGVSSGYPQTGRRGGMGGGWPGGGGGYPGGGGRYPGGRGGQGPSSEPHVDGKKIMEQICGETGGFMFEAKKQKFDDDFASIAEELRTQYVLGFTPAKDQTSGYHKIALSTKSKDEFTQTRAGYYATE